MNCEICGKPIEKSIEGWGEICPCCQQVAEDLIDRLDQEEDEEDESGDLYEHAYDPHTWQLDYEAFQWEYLEQ